MEDGLVYFGLRVIIPNKERKQILEKLHSSHQGIEKTKKRARASIYWPGINNEIVMMINNCDKCQESRPSQTAEPMVEEPIPERIFQDVSADYFSIGQKEFLIIVDRLSNWPVVFTYNRGETKTKSLIHSFRKYFADVGIPERLRTDSGPQFRSREFRKFLEKYHVKHEMSTPYHHEANGHAEAGVKAMKKLIMKTTKNGNLNSDEFCHGLLEYRNTPSSRGESPASIVFGCNLKSLIPVHHEHFDRKWKSILDSTDQKFAEEKLKSKKYHDRGTRSLEEIKMGVDVRLQNPITNRWDEVGEVVGKGKFRAYLIKFPSGRLKWRNRKFIKPL